MAAVDDFCNPWDCIVLLILLMVLMVRRLRVLQCILNLMTP